MRTHISSALELLVTLGGNKQMNNFQVFAIKCVDISVVHKTPLTTMAALVLLQHVVNGAVLNQIPLTGVEHVHHPI